VSFWEQNVKTFTNYINGQRSSSVTGKTIPILNPAHRSEIVANVQAPRRRRRTHRLRLEAFDLGPRTPPPSGSISKAGEFSPRTRDKAATLLVKE
jgi:hypothetical protein